MVQMTQLIHRCYKFEQRDSRCDGNNCIFALHIHIMNRAVSSAALEYKSS